MSRDSRLCAAVTEDFWTGDNLSKSSDQLTLLHVVIAGSRHDDIGGSKYSYGLVVAQTI
jgi:hypothetical protein